MSGPADVPIRTPDQRLRVFVSSTLKELEPERRAARAAIERLRLAPVMFELGARPHPPRELYRAYLEQSDVFVGLYWQEYGWVAPGEEVSGLEDEWRLAPRDMPRLVYVKQPAEREPRLAELMTRIRDAGSTSYTPFTDAAELTELIEADLATLLAERFDASRHPSSGQDATAPATETAAEPAPTTRLPAPYTEAVGREREVATLLEWLGDDAHRLVTLVGPGGIGKSRLAIEVARSVGAPFDRVTFVPLAQVRDPADVLPTVARALGLRDTDERPLSEQLGVARAGRHDLVVLDNFEQVLDAAPDVAALLTDLPDALFLVTSRARLRIRGEQVFDVDPLGLPPDPVLDDVDAILEAPAVQLFLDRAQAADARFEVTAENAGDVARICRALEGVPLAIELASARIRALTPAAMLARLDRMLPLLVTSARDVPERQRTIRATVEWSVDLLGPEAETLFARLGVFAGDFSLDAVESVTEGEPWATDLLGTLLELVDGSLLRQHDDAGTSLFTMLVPVREVAAARFELDPDAAAVRRAHADHYVRLAAAIEPRLRGATQAAALERLEAEQDDVRAGYRHLIAIGDVEPVADAVWRLLFYWWIRNMLPEAKAWMTAILESDVPLSGRTRAIAMTFSSWVSLWQADGELRAEPMEESVALFREDGDELSEGLSLAILSLVYLSVLPPDLERAEARVRSALELEAIRRDGPYDALFRASLGRIRLMRGDAADAARILEAAWDDAARIGDPFIESIAVNQFGWAHLVLGDPRPDAFARSLELAYGLNSEDGGAYGLEGLAAASAALGDFERAGVMLGIADAMRARTGLSDQRSIVTYQQIIAQVLEGDHSDAFETGRARGRRMPRRAAVALALGQEPPA
ncbi:ATP-binding protein [Agromyces sp. NPDC057865]|uniref:ATP-binding protein n=1 Tax=Agromyces sp. NPDC057865 TaxID=3346267 RepID=UPI00366B2A13